MRSLPLLLPWKTGDVTNSSRHNLGPDLVLERSWNEFDAWSCSNANTAPGFDGVVLAWLHSSGEEDDEDDPDDVEKDLDEKDDPIGA